MSNVEKQESLFQLEPLDNCYTCHSFSELKQARKIDENITIYGYCFKDGVKPHSPNMGKGFPVYVPEGNCETKTRQKPR